MKCLYCQFPYKICLLFLLFALPALVWGGNKTVLFIGNSYTGTNNLPNMLRIMCASAGDTLTYQAHTPGGARLLNHTQDPEVYAKIRSKNWDYVVIQAQSQEPAFTNDFVVKEVFPYARQLCDSIRANNICSQPLFYMTWGRKNGDQTNCRVIPALCTYVGMDSLLNLRYQLMAKMNKADVSPVGAVWHYIRDSFPSIELYNADESHPSMAGTYAAAATFYSMIFNKDPNNIEFTSGLNKITVAQIKEAVKYVAFDRMNSWIINKPQPKPGFTFKLFKDSISITNTSDSALNYTWSFGDSTFSTYENPSHVYTKNGKYLLRLTAHYCQNSSSIDSLITISSIVGLKRSADNLISIYPNPANGMLHFSNIESGQEVVIFNSNGNKVLKAKMEENSTINISSLPVGVYWLKLDDELFQFLKQ
ncbi:MAG: T9SS type A sorting domain-containing protein [Bacteroidetes bacterium]|nr:T9SS type A sorting domain-containing protein [Bacteroidota bacterium]